MLLRCQNLSLALCGWRYVCLVDCAEQIFLLIFFFLYTTFPGLASSAAALQTVLWALKMARRVFLHHWMHKSCLGTSLLMGYQVESYNLSLSSEGKSQINKDWGMPNITGLLLIDWCRCSTTLQFKALWFSKAFIQHPCHINAHRLFHNCNLSLEPNYEFGTKP